MNRSPLTLVGDDAPGGVYILRLAAARPLRVAFGRFRRGEPIPVPAGDLLYVGSALGPGGLGRRLVRHATRTAGRPPHLIRASLLSHFALSEPRPKTLFWHVDYLLDETAVSFVHVYARRSAERLEGALADALAADPATTAVAPGLGASDRNGAAHLLAVRAGAAWWAGMAGRLARLEAG